MTPFNNPQLLAAWLALEHPQFFAYAYRVLRAPGMAGFGQDVSATDAGTTTTFDTTDTSSTDAIPEITVTAPSLVPVGITDTLDVNSLAAPNIDASQLATSAVPEVTNSGESTSWLSSIGTGLSNAVASMAGFLSSKTGLTSLANLGTAYYKANTPQAAVISTQAARVGSGAAPGAITYATNQQGQLVPVAYNKAGSAFPLSSSALSGLIPSSSSGWLVLGGGILLLAALASRSGKRRR